MHYLYTRIYNAFLPLDLSLKLIDHPVLPILLYGAEIFGYENTDILERIHSNFFHKITNSRKSTPMSFLYGELGRYPISMNTQSRVVSFWNRNLVGKSEKFILKIYKYMIHIQDNNFKWPNKIREILHKEGRPDLWDNQFLITYENIHKMVKKTLIDQFKQKLQSNNKGKIYLSLKINHEFESYFKKLSRQDYLPLLKFQTDNHFLPVETGRYDGTPFEERKCNLCNLDTIGNEKHYVLECTFFENERNLFLENMNNRNFKTLMNPHSVAKLKKLSHFVTSIMKPFNR